MRRAISTEEEEELEDFESEKIDIEQIERSLRRRRQIKLALICLGFILNLGLIQYSVLVDIKTQKSEYFNSSSKSFISWFSCSGLSMLEEIICAENDDHCLSLLCPVSMRFNPDTQRCDSELDIALAGVVGNIKEMCREGFVWVQWKGQCLRRN